MANVAQPEKKKNQIKCQKVFSFFLLRHDYFIVWVKEQKYLGS